MQKTLKKHSLLLNVSLVVAVIATSLRFVAMYLGFDFETKFFTNKLLVTLLYAFVLLFVVFAFKALKNARLEYDNKKDNASFVLNIFCSIVFALVFFIKINEGASDALLDKVTWYISVIFSLASVCYYVLNRIDSSWVRVLNLCPVIYLIAELVRTFVSVSSKANSYYIFPNIIALLALAFYILNEGKSKVSDISEASSSLYSASLISFVLLIFSALPDIAMMITHGFELTKSYVLITALKLIYLVMNLRTVVKFKTLTENNEDEK